MRKLSPYGEQTIGEIAGRHGFSFDAARELLDALVAGNGSMAQFSHPEFSGSGQWMRGGMTMVSDMFNHRLAARVDAFASELSELLVADAKSRFEYSDRRSSTVATGESLSPAQRLFSRDPVSTSNWWPSELGMPSSEGRQNEMRYAYFGGKRRLAVDAGEGVRVYDTLGADITGVSQQQSTFGTISFSSGTGAIDLSAFRLLRAQGRED